MNLTTLITTKQQEARVELAELDAPYCLSGCGCTTGKAYHDGICVWGDNPAREDFTDALIFSTAQAVLDAVKEEIKETGHQQEDDTIWCNMDELLSRLEHFSSNDTDV